MNCTPQSPPQDVELYCNSIKGPMTMLRLREPWYYNGLFQYLLVHISSCHDLKQHNWEIRNDIILDSKRILLSVGFAACDCSMRVEYSSTQRCIQISRAEAFLLDWSRKCEQLLNCINTWFIHLCVLDLGLCFFKPTTPRNYWCILIAAILLGTDN